MTIPTLPASYLPALNCEVGLTDTDTGERVAWTVAAHEGSDVVVLTRRAVAPGTSLDRCMGNGPCPTYGTTTKRVRLAADGACETLSEDWARA